MDIFLEEAAKHLVRLRFAVGQGTAETVEIAACSLRGELDQLGSSGDSANGART
jgi:hypothetical protein